MTVETKTHSSIGYALAYARRGLRVHPLHNLDGGICTCGAGGGCQTPAKHPRLSGWQKQATTDEDTIRGWWQQWPGANIGIVTGAKSGIVVVDVDPRNGGNESLANLEAEYGELPETPEVRTGGGGRHLYFKHPGSIVPGATIAPGLEIKGDGENGNGQNLVAAGSFAHKGGRVYEWDAGRHIADIALAPVPAWLLAMVPGDRRNGKTAEPIPDVILNGTAHNTLVSLSGTMRRRGMNAEEIGAALLAVNRRLEEPASAETIRRIAESVAQYPPASEPYRLTDVGNAERLIARHGEAVRHVGQWGWLVWSGKRWELDQTGAIMRFAKATAASIYAEAAAEPADKLREAIANWAKKSESESRLAAMISLAASDPAVVARPADFDADPMLFNCANGTLDLRTGLLLPHRREDLITKLASVRFDPQTTCPRWLVFLQRVLPSADVRRYVQKVAGHCLTADTREQELYFAHGGGANGKSTFINALLSVLGDYGKQAAPDLLVLQRGDSRHPTELADLLGARFVASVEVEEGRKLAEVLVKQMTGGDPIKARHMRQDFFQFVPTHKIFFAANHKPTVHGTDYAIW